MDTRYSVHPEDAKHYTTQELRERFHIDSLFTTDCFKAVYAHDDRVIVMGAMPARKKFRLNEEVDCATCLGTDYFMERREMGIINIGGAGTVTLDGQEYKLGNLDGLYVSMGTKEVVFASDDAMVPAKFYMTSVPANRPCPTRLVTLEQANKVPGGDKKNCNERMTNQYFHSSILETNQLQMGLTQMAEGSVWMTMPPHMHERRMEIYFYCNMASEDITFHLMGRPEETRHVVMKNEEAMICPSWSIHSCVGTGAYALVWSMAGENINYADMDMLNKTELL